MKKTALMIALAGLVIGGMSLVAPKNASAGIGISFGNRSGGYGHSHYDRGYNSNRFDRGYNRGYDYGYGNQWSGYGQNRGHYDYHPTTIVPHGNHFDVQPGHYDYHRGGHGYNRGGHGHHH